VSDTSIGRVLHKMQSGQVFKAFICLFFSLFAKGRALTCFLFAGESFDVLSFKFKLVG